MIALITKGRHMAVVGLPFRVFTIFYFPHHSDM